MDEYIFENVAPQRRNIDYPWLMSAGRNLWDETWGNTVEEAKRYWDWLATQGSNLKQTTEEREARLLGVGEAELQGRVEDRLAAEVQARAWEEDAGGLPTRDITSQGSVAKALGIDRKDVPAYLGGTPREKEKKEMDEWEQAFLLSMMENMRGEDIGQAPAVVAGGGQRQWPSMMGQFAPWEQQKPYWWIT